MFPPGVKDIRLFMVGHFFEARYGLPTSQAEILRTLLQREGANVYFASSHIRKIPRLLDTLWQMWKYASNYQVVQIHSYGGKALVLEDAVSLWAKLLGKKIIFTLHAGSFPQKIRQFPAWYKRVYGRGSALTCPSPYLKHQLEIWLPSLQIIPNQLKIDAYPLHVKHNFQPNLLWMRTFEDAYHPEMALEVVALLKPVFPEVKLYMAGADRGLLVSIKNKAKEAGLDKHVIFPGFLNHQDKLRLAKACDIFLCTNRIDNAPVSLLEMAALGLPIVSTDVGGIPYFFQHGQNAILVRTGDASAMAEAVKSLCQQPEHAKMLVQKARMLAEKHDEALILRQWTSLFNRLQSPTT